MDNFYEQLNLINDLTLYKTLNVVTYILAAIAVIFAGFLKFFISTISITISIILFFVKKFLYVEYEYIFTNGEIDIDSITEAKNRKKVISFNIRDVELLTKEKSNEYKELKDIPKKKLKCITNKSRHNFVAVINVGAQRMQLVFSPDEKFLELCQKYNPRGVKL